MAMSRRSGSRARSRRRWRSPRVATVGVRCAARLHQLQRHHRACRCLRPLTRSPRRSSLPVERFASTSSCASRCTGDHGFYTFGGQAGRRGDFITSPEVGPLFGAVLARWIDAEWRRLGEPDDFTIVECGAGPGTLARGVLAAAPQWRDRYVAVEVSAAAAAPAPRWISSERQFPPDRSNGVVIANELLDNLPFRLAVFDGGWREVTVSLGRAGRAASRPRWRPTRLGDWLPRRRLPRHTAAGRGLGGDVGR